MEPRATPAATRGPQPHPGNRRTTTKTDSRTRTEHKNRYSPASRKHLKSLVLDHLYRWKNPPVLDPDTELILGDCVHNLRSALDHLAYQLVVLNKRTPDRRSNFPIFDHPHRKRRKCWLRRVPLLVPGISPQANQIIENIQPYQKGDIGHRLAELRELDNIDKHRHLLITVQAVNALVTAWWGDQPPHGMPDSVFTGNAPVHGEVAVRVRWPIPRPDLDPYLHFAVGVRFDRRLGKLFGRRPVSSVLSNLLSTVENDVVNALFAPLFP